jgi:hypothetical protein
VTALASWASEAVDVVLSAAQGPVAAYAPAIEGFQPERRFAAGEAVRVEPGRGWLVRVASGASPA